MSGERANEQSDDQPVDVNVVLEQDIRNVEQVVGNYLDNPAESVRTELLAVLERLDEQIDLSDAYQARISYPAGRTSTVVGGTSDGSVVEDISNSEYQAQIALVIAAKSEVTEHNSETFATLSAAFSALAPFRSNTD